MQRKRRWAFFHFVLAYQVVLFIPLLIISFNVLRLLRDQQLHRLEREAALTLERQESFWNQQLSVMRSFHSKIKFDKKYNELYTELPGAYLDIMTELRLQEGNLPFVQGIFLFDPDKKIVISSQGNIGEELFFGRICRVDEAVFEEEEDFSLSAAPASLQGKQGVLLSSPINTWKKEGAARKHIFYFISDRSLSEQFGPSGDMETVLFFGEKRLFSSSPLALQLLETKGASYHFERELGGGFRLLGLVDRAHFENGVRIYLEAYGLWLLFGIAVGLILAFLFSDRRYRDFRSMLDYSQKLEDERNRLRQGNCLYGLLSKRTTGEDALWRESIESGIALQRMWKCFVLLPEETREGKKENREMLLPFSCFFSKVGDKDISMYVLEAVEGMKVYFLCFDGETGPVGEVLQKMREQGVQIGIGDMVREPSKLLDSYREAKRRYDTFFTIERQYPQRELQSLKEAMENSDLSRTSYLLQELISYVKESREMGIRGVMWDAGRLFSIDPNRLLEQKNGDRNTLVSQAVSFLSSLEEGLSKQKQTGRFTGSYKKKEILDLLRYLHDHCLEETFSVKKMAADFETSVSNISHFFKKNMGISISQYIEQIKLERAKDWLANSKKTIAEIAEKLCYSSSNPFIEMFKKNTGMTPGTFRENALKEKENHP